MIAQLTFAIVLTLASLCGVLSAQERQPPAMPDPKACAPGERMAPNRPSGAPITTGENLSNKLARTDGVICPPNVDPEIRLPTPDTGRTPVIPPPGSPGGNPNVRPK